MIEKVIEIAQEASKLVLEVYNSKSYWVSQKADASPVTKADMLAHEYLSRELLAAFTIPVLSEEAPPTYASRQAWEEFWLIDPLDGTKDFLARDDEFTVNIALIRRGEPVLGVIAVPAKGLVYYAEKGLGAYRKMGTQRERVSYQPQVGRLACTLSRLHKGERSLAFCKSLGATQVVDAGSALKFCLLAEGQVDVYVRLSPNMEWDIAAGHCLLRESGCQLIDFSTWAEPKYNSETLLNNGFIAAAKLSPLVASAKALLQNGVR